MDRYLTILFCVFLAAASAKNLIPRDLADEAGQQVNELNEIVQGEILKAHDDLSYVATDFETNSKGIEESGGVGIQQEYESIGAQLTTIKDWAKEVNADISSCLGKREAYLNQLPRHYTGLVGECVIRFNDQANGYTNDAKYIVDVLINKVTQLDFQIQRCKGDILCISPLMTEIELNKVRLPQNIRTEVQASTSLVTILKPSVQSRCSDDNIAEFITMSLQVISDVYDCAERIIDNL